MKKTENNPSVGFSWSGFDKYGNYKAEIQSTDMTQLVQHIEGCMLTIADAAFVDQEQRKAVKSLIKNKLWSEIYELTQQALFQRQSGNKFPLG